MVALERDALEAGVGLVELDDPLHARAPPPVERLILVADAEERVVGSGQDPHEQLLCRLDVLVLIDVHALEAALPALAQPVVRAQGAHGQEDLVVEVVAPGFGLVGLVEVVERGDRLLARVVRGPFAPLGRPA